MLLHYAHNPTTRQLRPIDESNRMGEQLIVTQSLTRTDVTHLVQTHGLSEHLLHDVFDANELPRVEAEGDFQYIFLRNSNPGKGKVNSYPVLLVTGKNLLLCLSARKDPTLNLMPELETYHFVSLQRLLIYAILAVAKNYETIIDHISDTTISVEQRMRRHEATNNDFYSFVTIETGLSRARMNLAGLATVVEKLTPGGKTKLDRELYDDIRLFARQLLVEIDSHLQTIKSIRETYSTVANNNLNQRMKLLTALTLLLALPNVFYSMYGMNVDLPFMHEAWIYPVLVGITVVIVILAYLIARKRNFF